jgi:S-adenosylmethionine decarboxylase
MHDSFPVGRHVIADISGITPEVLRDGERIMRVLRRALEEAGFRRLKELSHRFSSGGEGFTGVILLAESHAAFHTYPERSYMALDVFGCGSADPRPVVETVAAELNAEHCDVREMKRSTEVEELRHA